MSARSSSIVAIEEEEQAPAPLTLIADAQKNKCQRKSKDPRTGFKDFSDVLPVKRMIWRVPTKREHGGVLPVNHMTWWVPNSDMLHLAL
jgi:hypothetical protein